MHRFLVLSAGFTQEHPARNLGIVRELMSLGHSVQHVAVGRGVPPGYPSSYASSEEFRDVGTRWVDRLTGLLGFLSDCDVVVVPNSRGISPIVAWARAMGRVVVQHDSVGGFDYFYYGADYVGVKGEYFREAMQSATEYDREIVEADAQGEVVRNTVADPNKTMLYTSHARLDAVALLLTRRQFEVWLKDDAVEAINLYSDASPVVGAELQGMVMDVHIRNEELQRLTMPGAMLAYGRTGWIDKTLALVWAVHLMVGSELSSLEYFFRHVVSITTDYGVELKCASLNNILPAFARWLKGESLRVWDMGKAVSRDSRLMPFVLRIGGWSHTMGNQMKEVSMCFPHYPLYLTTLRSLCKFFRN